MRSYDFGNKNQWRNWAWDRILERMHTQTKDAVVLYLAGTENLDLGHANRYRFSFNNLIAIEKTEASARPLRSNGTLCVVGELFDVLRSWPASKKVSIIHADLCCGLERNVVEGLMDILGRSVFDDCVFCFNLMRGRDSSTNGQRAWFDAFPLGLRNRAEEVFGVDRKHRGFMLITLVLPLLANHLSNLANAVIPVSVNRARSRGQDIASFMSECSLKVYNSYRSESGQTFDSVIFKNPFGEMKRRSCPSVDLDLQPRSDKRTKARISAILAHRTMRLKDDTQTLQ